MSQNTIASQGTMERGVLRFSHFLSGGRFAMFVLWVLFLYDVFVAVMTFAPIRGGAAGAFVEDFRIRCFQYNTQTGGMEWSSVFVMLAEPLPLAGIVFFIWWRQLHELWRAGLRPLASPGLPAVLIVGLIGVGLAGVSQAQAKQGDKSFPAARLRSALPMPSFQLVDQDGQMISPAGLKGRVVLVTAVYSTCTSVCPMMLKGIRSILDELSDDDRQQLTIVALSLNPETDTRELRSMIANAYNFGSGQFHFVNGEPAVMNSLLDRLGVSRLRDPQTGELIHSSLFLLLDRQGRIAYRLSNSEREQSWLVSAVRTLLAEPAR
jgi:protein SCO1/2